MKYTNLRALMEDSTSGVSFFVIYALRLKPRMRVTVDVDNTQTPYH